MNKIQPWLSLLQWCDSNFPSGAFTQSFGMETYILEGKISDAKSLLHWLRIYLYRQLVYSDGLACKLAYAALEQGKEEQLWYFDCLITVQNLPRETREGCRRMGERMLNLAIALDPSPLLHTYMERVREKRSFAHPALVFAILAWQWKVDEQMAVVSYLSTTLFSLVQNGVRAIPLGQTEGQRVMRGLQLSIEEAYRHIEGLTVEDLGAVTPGLELAQIRHEWIDARQFMS